MSFFTNSTNYIRESICLSRAGVQVETKKRQISLMRWPLRKHPPRGAVNSDLVNELTKLLVAYSYIFLYIILMLIGILCVLTVQAARGKFTPEYFSPMEVSGLYWHFVDIVWIFLFPLLYLIGGRT